MLSTGTVDENLRFLILEVIRQVERTRTYLRSPSERTEEIILRGDDYIDHLRTIIQRKCFALAREVDQNDRFEMELLKSLDLITANLERIADFCENIVEQFRHLRDPAAAHALPTDAFFDQIVSGLEQIEPTLFDRDVHRSLEICRVERRLDELHARVFASVLENLDAGEHAQTQVTVLFMSHYFERMGDSVLNIGEALLSAALGERIKIDQFRALRNTVADSDEISTDLASRLLTVEALGETRSGCRIDRIADHSGEEERMVVFKEGHPDKLIEEKECVDRWNEVMPGFAPQIYSFQQREDSGAILFEYLPGRTVEELILRSRPEQLEAAIHRLETSLRDIWTKSKHDEPVRPGFVAQTRTRIRKVYELHPDLRGGSLSFGGLDVVPFDELLERAAPIDDLLEAPFSVLGHGDLNIDNVIYDSTKDRIRLIDLHRSDRMDYAHDVAVFLVSNLRLQVLDEPVRERIQSVVARVRDFAGEFAERNGDPTFGARLATGLARNFATSARFVLDEDFAKELFYRSRYLFEQLVATPAAALPDFEAPGDILID